MNAFPRKQRQSGVTLVELMVALVVSSILLLGVAQIYSTSKRSSKVNSDFAALQENARIALNFLVKDIRMAGYMGCAFNNGGTQFQCYLNSANNYICNDFKTGLVGYNFTGTEAQATSAYQLTVDSSSTPPNQLNTGTASSDWANYNLGTTTTGLPSSFPAGAVVGSDVIIIKHGAGTSYPLASNNTASDLQFDPGSSTAVPAAGDIMLVSDCKKATVFQAGQITGPTAPSTVLTIAYDNTGGPTPGNSKTSWDVATSSDPDVYLSNDSNVMKYQTWAYYVANNTAGEPALYRHDGISGDAAQELVEGIENMQILYGIDTSGDGTANYYASANQVDFTDTTKPVVSVRISLLVRSKNQIPKRPSASNTYTLATTPISNASDQRLRKVFTTTIKIRNKGDSL